MFPVQITITLQNVNDLQALTSFMSSTLGGVPNSLAAAVGGKQSGSTPGAVSGRVSSDPANPTGENLTTDAGKAKAAAATAAPKDKVAPGGKAHEKKVAEVRKELMSIGATVGMDPVKEIVGEYADALEKVPTDKLDEVLEKVKALLPTPEQTKQKPAATTTTAGDEAATFANTSPLLLKLAAKNSAKVQEIIKQHGGGAEKLSKCAPATFPAIKAALQAALDELG